MGKIRIRHGENEIDLEGSDVFIGKHLKDFYNRVSRVPSSPRTSVKQELLETSTSKSRHLTPAEYYRSKGKSDGISQILVFAKYLEENQGVSEFTRPDINKVAKEARVPKDIHTQYFTNAVKQGLLRSHGKGRYSLTLSAEDVLAAMK